MRHLLTLLPCICRQRVQPRSQVRLLQLPRMAHLNSAIQLLALHLFLWINLQKVLVTAVPPLLRIRLQHQWTLETLAPCQDQLRNKNLKSPQALPRAQRLLRLKLRSETLSSTNSRAMVMKNHLQPVPRQHRSQQHPERARARKRRTVAASLEESKTSSNSSLPSKLFFSAWLTPLERL